MDGFIMETKPIKAGVGLWKCLFKAAVATVTQPADMEQLFISWFGPWKEVAAENNAHMCGKHPFRTVHWKNKELKRHHCEFVTFAHISGHVFVSFKYRLLSIWLQMFWTKERPFENKQNVALTLTH